jgi:hypothetical protein
MWMFQQMGGNIFTKFYAGEQTPTEKSPGEEFLSLPILSNIIGRFIRVSDYGQLEKYREKLQEIRGEKARERIDEDKLVNEYQIDITHFTGQGYLKGGSHNWGLKIPLEEILVENSTYLNTNTLRKRLIKCEIFEKKCYCCNCITWLDKPIPLELEHKNGDRTDNRIDNLTLLCPNCHAFTPTYRRSKLKIGIK